MIRNIERILLWALICAAVLYAIDYASLVTRFPGNREQLSTVEVMRFLVFEEKFHKESYAYKGTDNAPCANSLFPHLGANPCWYVKRHKMVMMPATESGKEDRDKIDDTPK